MVLKSKKVILGSLAVVAAVSPIAMTVSCGSKKCDKTPKWIKIAAMQIIDKISNDEGKTFKDATKLPKDGYKINGLKFSKDYLTKLIKSFEYVKNIKKQPHKPISEKDSNFVIGREDETQKQLSSTIKLKSDNNLNRFTKKGYNWVKEAINHVLYKNYNFNNIDLSKLKCYQQLAEDTISSINVGDKQATILSGIGNLYGTNGGWLLSRLHQYMMGKETPAKGIELKTLKDWNQTLAPSKTTKIIDNNGWRSIFLSVDEKSNVHIQIQLVGVGEMFKKGTDTALTKPENLKLFNSLDWNSIFTNWINSSIKGNDLKKLLNFINKLKIIVDEPKVKKED